MGISDTFKKLVGIEEVEDDFDDEELEAEKERISRESVRKPQIEYKAPKAMGDTTKAVPIDRRISVAGTSAFKLVVIEPKSFDECPKLVDSLKGRRPVIINLEKIETETAKKIFDFLSRSYICFKRQCAEGGQQYFHIRSGKRRYSRQSR